MFDLHLANFQKQSIKPQTNQNNRKFSIFLNPIFTLQVKLTQEELSKIIEQTQGKINDLENEDEESDKEDNPDQSNVENENGTNEAEGGAADRDIDKIYGLDTYDDDDENEVGLALGGLVLNPCDDPYLKNLDADDDDEKSDIKDFNIKLTDNLILVGHVEGEAAILEVYGMFCFSLFHRAFSWLKNAIYHKNIHTSAFFKSKYSCSFQFIMM